MYKIPNTDLIAMDESEYLEHFGVSGMKWGHRKALAATKGKMRSAESFGSAKKASSSQKAEYEKASADYYNKKRALNGKSKVNSKVAAYRQDIKNDAVKGAKYLGSSFVLKKTAQSLAMVSQHSSATSPFLSNVAGISAGLLKGASIGSLGVGAYYSSRAGIKRVRGGKNGDGK